MELYFETFHFGISIVLSLWRLKNMVFFQRDQKVSTDFYKKQYLPGITCNIKTFIAATTGYTLEKNFFAFSIFEGL